MARSRNLLGLLLAWPLLAATIPVDGPQTGLAAACKAAKAGEVVLVQPGIYRESVRPGASGEPHRPITFRAAGPGVVFSGADAITGWTKAADGRLWQASVNWQPTALFCNNAQLDRSHEPNEGWFYAAGGGTNTVIDPEHLKRPAGSLDGAHLFFWDVDAGSQNDRAITALDSAAGQVTLDGVIYRDRTVEAGVDRYRLENHPAFIDQPGEWAAMPDGAGFKVVLMPPNGVQDPNAVLIEAPRRDRFVVETGSQSHLRFEGFEIRHGVGHGIGTWAGQPQDVAVVDCWIHDNLGAGIYFRGIDGPLAKGNLVARNGTGINVSGCQKPVIEANEIADNWFDGMDIAGGTTGAIVRRNFMHGHTWWGHCDNFQLFGGVKDIVIEQNVLLNGGQALMMEATDGGVFRGNLVLGSLAAAVIAGHGNTNDFTIEQNTIAYTGYGGMPLAGKTYRVHRNVFYPGTTAAAFSVTDPTTFVSDHNLIFRPPFIRGPLFAYGRNWPGDFEAYRKLTDQDANSISADPLFVNAPLLCARMDDPNLAQATRDSLPVKSADMLFEVGDPIEFAFDGVIRKVTAVAAGSITFGPPLAARPMKGGLLLNWRGSTKYELDLRLRDGSPGKGLGADVDLAAMRRGDVDGDGVIDIRRATP